MSVRASRSRPDDGFTFIEVIITVALLSIAFVGILTAVAGMITSGAQNQSASTVEASVRSVASYLQSFSTAPYVACNAIQPPIAAYQNDLDLHLPQIPVPAGYTPHVDFVQYWNGDTPATFTPPVAPPSAGTCPTGGDQGLELVTVSVKDVSSAPLGGAFSRTLAVLKRSTA